MCVLSCVQPFLTPRTVVHQPPLSMGFPKQEYWSGLPLPPPEDLPNTRMEPASPVSPSLEGGLFFFFFLPLSQWTIGKLS